MPGIRTLVVALALGLGVGLYLELWLRWPTFLNVGVGAFLALVALLISAALGEDPEAADAAWREAAPDLVRRRLGPEDDGRPEGGG